MIPYARQSVTQCDIDAVVKVLQSDFLTQGPVVPRFEQAISSRVGARHAIAVNSATSALHIACLALGLTRDDILWTVPNTFVASANCARYCGAEVDFVDIDPFTWNLSVAALREKLAHAKRTGRLPKVVVPVHFGGQPTQQEEIWELARQYGFKVLEDASHSIGASRNGEPVGSCRWSDITVFSFHAVKIITTGEGGMALTNDDRLASDMRILRTHGITRDPATFSVNAGSGLEAGHSPGAWYYEQKMLGFNYRLTDVQAALGVSQLRYLDQNVEIRNQLALRYDEGLKLLPLRLPGRHPDNRSAFHIYVVRLRDSALSRGHLHVFNELRGQGIGVNLHYLPVHLQPYYRALGFSMGQFPEAEAHGREAITLPMYPGLTAPMQEQVLDSLHKVLAR